jgi:hypothetical protein
MPRECANWCWSARSSNSRIVPGDFPSIVVDEQVMVPDSHAIRSTVSSERGTSDPSIRPCPCRLSTASRVFESRSAVSPASSRAVLRESLPRLLLPESSLASMEFPVEPAHLHGVDDTSVHLCLGAARAAEVCAAGWGEEHQRADHGAPVMVYGPRDDAELDPVVGLIAESIARARRANGVRSQAIRDLGANSRPRECWNCHSP